MNTNHIFRLLLPAALAAAAAACYDDNGNYDYSILSGVETGDRETLYATQFTTLNIPVEMKYTGDATEADYDFSWRIWAEAVGGVWDQKKDICTTRDLKYDITEIPGTYNLVLTCHNRMTGVDAYKEYTLIVQGVITEGWMVLHDKDGKTDFDLIMSPYFSRRVDEEKIIHNVFESINGTRLEGKGRKIASFTCLGRYQSVTVLTDRGGAKLDAITMRRTFDIPTLFRDMSDWNPESYIFCHNQWGPSFYGFDAIVSNGRYYMYSCIPSMGYSTYTEPLCKNGLTYKASPYAPRYLEYSEGVLYDDEHGRFLTVVQGGSHALSEFAQGSSGSFCDLSDMNATLRCMETGFYNWEYGLFRNKTTGKNELYAFKFDSRTDISKGRWDASGCPEIDKATFFAAGELGPVFYYATDRNVYHYDYSGSNTARLLYTLQAADEKITGMKIFKPRETYFINHPYNSGILILSTHNVSTGEGKVYMFYINVSNGSIDTASEKVFPGFGEIKDMDYNFPKYGS